MAVKKTTAVNRSTNSHILIYNRVGLSGCEDLISRITLQVPKCGSTTVGGVLKDLSRQNNFSIHFSNNSWRYLIQFWDMQ